MLSLEEAKELVGNEIGLSAWRVVSQDMIDKFADATDDHQFIHCDPERAATETPFGGTIAHGFLSLSLLSAMFFESVPQLRDIGMGVNFGFEKVRFMAPIRSGTRVRGRFVFALMKMRPSGITELEYDVTVEIENSLKPALTARWQTLAMPDRWREKMA